MLFSLLQTDIATGIATEVAPVQQEMTYTLFEMAVKGGWLMIVLLLLSIIAIYIFLLEIRRAGGKDGGGRTLPHRQAAG